MGFSSVELLISMVLGLLVVGAIGSLFVQHKTNYRQNEQFALMQENGRFTLNLLASDLASSMTATLANATGGGQVD